VYEEAAKEVALSVLSGINCEFFFLHKNECPRNFYINNFGRANLIFDYLFDQQAFLLMDKQAAEKHTP